VKLAPTWGTGLCAECMKRVPKPRPLIFKMPAGRLSTVLLLAASGLGVTGAAVLFGAVRAVVAGSLSLETAVSGLVGAGLVAAAAMRIRTLFHRS
jgi:hypothetical protein